MNSIELIDLLDNKIVEFKNERVYQKGNFFKISKENDVFSLTKYLPASCASFYNAPNIKFTIIDDDIKLISYLDNSESPTISIQFNDSNELIYQEKLHELEVIINKLLQIDYFIR